LLELNPSAVVARDEDIKGSIVYSLTGVYPAQNFFTLNPSNAEIRIKQDLKTDSLHTAQYQLQVVAYDSLYPGNVATATVVINVERNPNKPKFETETYTVTIDEKHMLGMAVLNITANDADQVTNEFTIALTMTVIICNTTL
jgi:hypothetical protein